jgi:thioredoxin 1
MKNRHTGIFTTGFALAMLTCAIGFLSAGCGRKEKPAAAPAPEQASATGSSVITLTAESFDAQTATQGVVLVDFWATWCPPCRMQGPIVERVAEQVKGRAVVAKLDVDGAKDVSRKFNIEAIPTLIVFKDGKPVKQFVGLTQATELTAAIDSALGGKAATGGK